MPRYFFDTDDGELFVADQQGIELASLEAAKLEAQKALAEMARDALPDGDQRTFAAVVKDETGRVLLRMGLTLVVEQGPGA
ncbi:DUF6894 family protein [Microvirga arsenatis]|uniref:DUF6894 domain-containing protein n=1 Tax=Microvirga arsenatis TaxID=2692265 RepID=A0ABW9Z1C0_9HYPH|nr:hypothetical protein [Microvirga arsenatis]NBJ10648.1 hypothetical protein [Microvirga arsenatis]NBJ24454.1 hypothetical protein [Microvirga arsenatis]